MSRIGKKPVAIPSGVTLTQDGQTVTAKGPKGELSFTLPDAVTGKIEGEEFTVTPLTENKTGLSMWGMSRTMVSNLIEGVTNLSLIHISEPTRQEASRMPSSA